MADTFAESQVPFLDMAANQVELGQRIAEHIQPEFARLGLKLESFVVENLSLPEELQKRLDERIGMNMIGDMNRYTQFQVAQSMPIAAANEGGGNAAIGAQFGAGLAMANVMAGAFPRVGLPPQETPPPQQPPQGGAPVVPVAPVAPAAGGAGPAKETKFCIECGQSMPGKAKFCPNCGSAQG
jgi:membrane protease subunit (stomatin/prohibitin family)